MLRLVVVLTLLATSVIASDLKPHTAAEWRAIMAKFVFTPRPDYPTALQYKERERTGYFRMHMDTQGKVASVTVLQSTGRRELDERAVLALRRWHAKPGAEWDLDMPITFVPYKQR
jgi:TonB family protein